MDIVKITCYNRTETMERADAIKFYTEGILCSDGSEQERYATILAGLVSGATVVSDEY